MRLPGILRSWNDDRGFGFIAPTHGGADIFVHISSLPADGSRPVEGERVTYELGRGANGRPQAVRVIREAIGNQARHRGAPAHAAPARTTHAGRIFRLVIGSLLVLACLAYGYTRFSKVEGLSRTAAVLEVSESAPAQPALYRCDGRTYCSQMASCAEAKYFLKNCPGVKMDGNHDGIPCEQQWCR